jgi:hypothetical protein
MDPRDITNIQYDDQNRIVSFTEGISPVLVHRDNKGRVSTVSTGIQGSGGRVEVVKYDSNGKATGSVNIPFGFGFTTCGSDIILNGKRYKGMGMNFYDAFVHSSADLTARFNELAAYEVPFVRINMGDFGAGSSGTQFWRRYLTNEASYWALMDTLVNASEAAGVGILCSMFFRYATFPDLMAYIYGKRDTLSEWGNPNSNTRNFMRTYTEKFVKRYRDRPFIYGWEFANEVYSPAYVDPTSANDTTGNVLKSSAGYGVTSGSPTEYVIVADPSTANGTSDVLTFPDITSAINDWAAVVRANDPHGRMITSGSNIPPTTAWAKNTGVYNSTGQPLDLYDQWVKGATIKGVTGFSYFEKENEADVSVMCAHIYQDANLGAWYFRDKALLVPGLIALCNTLAIKNDKPFLIGEFGSIKGGNGAGTTDIDERIHFQETVAAIVNSGVPLSLVWNYGYQAASVPSIYQWNTDPATSPWAVGREYGIQVIAPTNKQLAASI